MYACMYVFRATVWSIHWTNGVILGLRVTGLRLHHTSSASSSSLCNLPRQLTMHVSMFWTYTISRSAKNSNWIRSKNSNWVRLKVMKQVQWLYTRFGKWCKNCVFLVMNWFSPSVLMFSMYTVSQKTRQLWNGIARNYKDRFWWHLAKIFNIR